MIDDTPRGRLTDDTQPWETEPNHIMWTTRAGLPAVVKRAHLGHLCGYVGIPSEHYLTGRSARRGGGTDVGGYVAGDDLSSDLDSDLMALKVHGGVTWGAAEIDRADGLTEEARKATTGVAWWIGFDASHANDLVPKLGPPIAGQTYRDMAYMRTECEKLAAQLATIQKPQ